MMQTPWAGAGCSMPSCAGALVRAELTHMVEFLDVKRSCVKGRGREGERGRGATCQ